MKPLIYASVTQGGLTIYASKDSGETYQVVQSRPFKARERRCYGWGTPTAVESPSEDVAEYFAQLDSRGIQYTREHSDANFSKFWNS